MSLRILVEQLNGETFELEVTAEMTMREVKMQIKRVHAWEDQLSRDTTLVEVILGDRKVMNEETVEELGLCDGSKVTVVFRKNLVQCSDKSGLGRDLDPEALVIVEIPDSETEIKGWAFQCCEQVAKVTIPSSVTRIGDRAFAGCSALAAVKITECVTQIGDATSFGCSFLVTINIPDSVTQIGAYAFERCSSLTSIDIPHSVTRIGHQAFHNCKQLTLRAPARLLGRHVSDVRKVVAKECGCGRCDWTWFGKGWVCPVRFPGK